MKDKLKLPLIPFQPIHTSDSEEYTAKFNLSLLKENEKWQYEFEKSYMRMVRHRRGTNYRETRTHNIDLYENKIIIENNSSRYNKYVFNNEKEALAVFSWITGYNPNRDK